MRSMNRKPSPAYHACSWLPLSCFLRALNKLFRGLRRHHVLAAHRQQLPPREDKCGVNKKVKDKMWGRRAAAAASSSLHLRAPRRRPRYSAESSCHVAIVSVLCLRQPPSPQPPTPRRPNGSCITFSGFSPASFRSLLQVGRPGRRRTLANLLRFFSPISSAF